MNKLTGMPTREALPTRPNWRRSHPLLSASKILSLVCPCCCGGRTLVRNHIDRGREVIYDRFLNTLSTSIHQNPMVERATRARKAVNSQRRKR